MFCVVALGGPVPEIQENTLVGYRWSAVGTGFFYGHLVKPEDDPTKGAKHVVDGWNTLRATIGSHGFESSELMIRVNPVTSLACSRPVTTKTARSRSSRGAIEPATTPPARTRSGQ